MDLAALGGGATSLWTAHQHDSTQSLQSLGEGSAAASTGGAKAPSPRVLQQRQAQADARRCQAWKDLQVGRMHVLGEARGLHLPSILPSLRCVPSSPMLSSLERHDAHRWRGNHHTLQPPPPFFTRPFHPAPRLTRNPPLSLVLSRR
jgi:hypothetical protein